MPRVPIEPVVPIGRPAGVAGRVDSVPKASIGPIGRSGSFAHVTRGSDRHAKAAAAVRANIFEYLIGHVPVIIEFPDSVETFSGLIHRTKNPITSTIAAEWPTHYAVRSLCWRALTTTVDQAIAGPGSRSGTAGNSVGYASPDDGGTLVGAASSGAVGSEGANVRYVSTRGEAPPLGFIDVTLAGLARDGGLYVPEAGRASIRRRSAPSPADPMPRSPST